MISCAVTDLTNGYVYFGTSTTPGRVIKAALGAPGQPPRRIASITLETGEDNLQCGVMDEANGYAYFGTLTSPGKIVKIALGRGAPPRRAALAR